MSGDRYEITDDNGLRIDGIPWRERGFLVQYRAIRQLRADLAAAVAERDRLRASIDDDFSGWRAVEQRWRMRAEQAEARLAAIDNAPTVATVGREDGDYMVFGAISFYRDQKLPIGTELIARPAKE